MSKTDILVLVFALSALSDTVTYGLDGNGSSNRICNAVLSFCFVEIVADPDLVLFAKSDFVTNTFHLPQEPFIFSRWEIGAEVK